MKTIFALSTLVAAALATGQAAAQSSVSIYGLLDMAAVLTDGGPKGSATRLDSGISNGSRIGFRGTEDLGGGLSAVFLLESGVLLDTGASDQNGTLFGRQAYAGLARKGLGTLTFGRQYTPIYHALTLADPFSNNYGGAAGQLMAGEKGGTRQNNTVMFASDKLQGFSGQLAYGFGEVAGDAARARQVGGSLSYERGALTTRIAYNRSNNATATDAARNTLLVAKYDFGPFAASLGYGDNRGMGKIDSRDVIVGWWLPMGAHELSGNLVHKSDRAGTGLGANQAAAVYTYALSKRTNVYLAYSRLSNTRFTTTKFGEGDRELDIGIKHRF